MKRRSFISLLGGAAAWPLAARAQQGKLPLVGFEGTGTPAAWAVWTASFVQRLRELGWVEGRTLKIEYRWAEARDERFAEIAAEFVKLKVDVIVAAGVAALAAKHATSVIPIVFPLDGDPIGTGLVTSLARPGGNVTGLSLQTTDIAAKRIEPLREVVPNLRRLAILANLGNPATVLEVSEVQAAARTLGLEALMFDVRRSTDIGPAMDAMKGRAEGLYVCAEQLTIMSRIGINILAAGAKLPTVSIQREFVEAGGLMSYGPRFPDLFRRAAEYVDKILRGSNPGDIPVEQPTKFELVVNLNTARALGLMMPESFLLRADEIIE